MSHAASESPTRNETRAAARALRARFDGAFGTARALDCLWVVSVFAGTFSAVLLFWGRVLLSDTYTSLTVGRLITQSGLPHKDTLTVAGRGATWIDQQWLAHLVVYESWRLGGYPLVGVLSAGLIATAFALMFVVMLSGGTNPVFAFGISGACFVVADLNFETRPQSFAYPLFMLLILLLAGEEPTPSFRPRLLLAWPVLLLWGNLHGSVLLGVGVCLLYCALRSHTAVRERRLTQIAWYSVLAIGAVVSSAITPYGTTIISYYPHLLGNPNLQSIAEWQPANYAGLSIPFDLLLAVAIGSICFAWGRGIRPSTFALVLAVGLAVMATQAVRYEVWFAFGAAFLLSDIRGRFDALKPRSSHLNSTLPQMAAIIMIVVAICAIAVVATTPTSTFERLTPPDALRWTASYDVLGGDHASVLTDDLTGSALTWAYPDLAGRVAFDSRTEIFPYNTFEQLARFLTLTGDWQASTHANYNVISVACSGRTALCQRLNGLQGWHTAYWSSAAIVLYRDPNPLTQPPG